MSNSAEGSSAGEKKESAPKISSKEKTEASRQLARLRQLREELETRIAGTASATPTTGPTHAQLRVMQRQIQTDLRELPAMFRTLRRDLENLENFYGNVQALHDSDPTEARQWFEEHIEELKTILKAVIADLNHIAESERCGDESGPVRSQAKKLAKKYQDNLDSLESGNGPGNPVQIDQYLEILDRQLEGLGDQLAEVTHQLETGEPEQAEARELKPILTEIGTLLSAISKNKKFWGQSPEAKTRANELWTLTRRLAGMIGIRPEAEILNNLPALRSGLEILVDDMDHHFKNLTKEGWLKRNAVKPVTSRIPARLKSTKAKIIELFLAGMLTGGTADHMLFKGGHAEGLKDKQGQEETWGPPKKPSAIKKRVNKPDRRTSIDYSAGSHNAEVSVDGKAGEITCENGRLIFTFPKNEKPVFVVGVPGKPNPKTFKPTPEQAKAGTFEVGMPSDWKTEPEIHAAVRFGDGERSQSETLWSN
ncbi:hypothetical protein A3A67_03845 [Candidatus Peribacteria bacterium RIFCSPLOWO2_01_FULL_51_18]|nr:MAG: hypothetical protein A3A67_03845 [Candidatus Peribacteria bacterium RIFCSPLOWO2_01_FULL_51_18]